MGQDDRQAIANEFLALRGRFERVAAISNDGGRDLRAAEAAAGKLLKRFNVAANVGLVLSDIVPTRPMSDDEAAQWAIVWKQGVHQLSFIYSDLPIINPLSARWEYRGGPERITIGKTDPEDWRIRAENYGAVCGALAGEIVHGAVAETVDHAGSDQQSANRKLSFDALAVATLMEHQDWTNVQIAKAIGCNPKTLNKKNMVRFKDARAAIKSGRDSYRRESLKDYGVVDGPDRRRRRSNINRYDPDDE